MILADSCPNLVQSPETSTTSDFKFSAYVDGSYNFLQNSNVFTSDSFNRVFDIEDKDITLQQAGITLAYQPKEGFGGLLNPVIGKDTYLFSPYGWNPDCGYRWLGLAIPQAFVQYAAGSLTLMAGNMLQLTGAESLFSFNNTNFSRSILFGYAEPYTVTGVRVNYVLNESFTMTGGINNGWDSFRDIGRPVTLELGLFYTYNPEFTLAAYCYTGQQRILDRTSDGPKGQRTLLDIVATIYATQELSFILNYDYGRQSHATLPNGETARAVWQGIAGYMNYTFNEQWRGSARAEFFDDQNGYRSGVRQAWREATITVGYKPLKELEIRAEARRDFSNKFSFVDKNGVMGRNYQQSFSVEGVYQFS